MTLKIRKMSHMTIRPSKQLFNQVTVVQNESPAQGSPCPVASALCILHSHSLSDPRFLVVCSRNMLTLSHLVTRSSLQRESRNAGRHSVNVLTCSSPRIMGFDPPLRMAPNFTSVDSHEQSRILQTRMWSCPGWWRRGARAVTSLDRTGDWWACRYRCLRTAALPWWGSASPY